MSMPIVWPNGTRVRVVCCEGAPEGIITAHEAIEEVHPGRMDFIVNYYDVSFKTGLHNASSCIFRENELEKIS